MDFRLENVLSGTVIIPGKISAPGHVSASQHYLERLGKLLTEDFLQPLRESLHEMKKNPARSAYDNLKFVGNFEVINEYCDKSMGFELRPRDNYLVDPPLTGSLLVALEESRTDFNNEIILALSEFTQKEGRPPLHRLQILDGSCQIGSVYKIFEYQVYLEAYIHHIKFLATLKNIRFDKYIIHSEKEISQPEYVKKSNKSFTFECLKKKKAAKIETLEVGEVYKLLMKKEDVKESKESSLASKTHDGSRDVFENWKTVEDCKQFDESQQRSISMCLNQELSLVQGPPGTGKTLIGTKVIQILLENKSMWAEKSSSPVLVICYTNSALDQFLEGLLPLTQKIVRLGGRSRSVSLEGHCVHNIRQYIRDNQLRSQHLYTQEREALSKLSRLSLAQNMDSEEKKEIKENLTRYVEELDSVGSQEARNLCRKADVVGVTSTGAAKYANIIHGINVKIVLIEEAGEILESHIPACLPSSTQQLVLIGDHKQLRPQVGSYRLARTEKHDISMFERLVSESLPYTQLNTQHRMIPEISALISPVYPELINHQSVVKREKVPGLEKQVYFVNHCLAEQQSQSGSKVNPGEASLCHAVVRYLLLQGISPHQVTVLTPYSGQLRLLRSMSFTSGIVLETVDNYQGYENKIVVLSLVRSGSSSIGFLSSENRVCVALSRARDSLIILGNLSSLAHSSSLWSSLKNILEDGGCVGNGLPVKCETHGRGSLLASPQDLDKLEDGGCGSPCAKVLSCGHQCDRMCHSAALRHSCNKPCQRQCSKGHECQKMCSEPCGECEFSIETCLPNCGHYVNVPCHVRPDLMTCPEIIEKQLPCGHTAIVSCQIQQSQESIKCGEICSDILDCGHACGQPCHGPSGGHPPCQAPCDRSCPGSGHPCPASCGIFPCPDCQVVVEKQLICGHVTSVHCSQLTENIECTKKCQRSLGCGHPCRSLCYEPCDDKCRYHGQLQLACGHTVTGRCADPPSCSRPCPLQLPCGHKCAGKCGGPCTQECKVLVVTSQSPGLESRCPHADKLPCYLANNKNNQHQQSDYDCKEKCGVTLQCGHKCTGICFKCTENGGLHVSCTARCSRRLLCGHLCPGVCGQLCPPCKDKSWVRCPHAKSSVKCGEVARPCKEKCTWRCQHIKCSKKCGSACSRKVCEEKCDVKLKCAHTCAAKCGEPCFCTECYGIKSKKAEYVKLSCDCPPVLADLIIKQNSDVCVRMLECPSCNKPVNFSHRFKQILNEKLERVAAISDYFFMKSTQLESRTESLVTSVRSIMESGAEDEKVMSQLAKILKILKNGTSTKKQQMTSQDVASLELKIKAFQILKSAESFSKLASGMLAVDSVNADVILSAVNTISTSLSAPLTGTSARLKNLEVLSYQAGLWKWCQTCDKLYQDQCQRCNPLDG